VSVRLRVFRDRGVDEAVVDAVLEAVVGVWGTAVTFTVERGPTIELPVALPGGAVGPLRTWVEAHARPPRRGIQLVVIPRVVDPGTKDLPADGLALPARAARDEDPAAVALRAALGAAPWTPSAFVAAASWLDRGRRPEVETMPAHEVGHLFGLAHADPGNLMGPYGGRHVTEAQAAAVAAWAAAQTAEDRAATSTRRGPTRAPAPGAR